MYHTLYLPSLYCMLKTIIINNDKNKVELQYIVKNYNYSLTFRKKNNIKAIIISVFY